MKHMKHGPGKRQKTKNTKKRNIIIFLVAIVIIAVSIISYIMYSKTQDLEEPTDLEYEEQNTIRRNRNNR